MPNIKGVKEVLNSLRKFRDKVEREENVEVVVGFTQSYSIYVHENKEARHTVGQAKFLEQPARQHRSKLGQIVTKVTERTGSILHGLLTAGMFLQARAQELTPVQTGALKASAFTDEAKNVEEASRKAFERSEQIRKSAK